MNSTIVTLGGDACPYFATWFGLAGASSSMIFSAM